MTATIIDNLVSLDEVLAYRHNGVIDRYCKEHRAGRAEAEEVFVETLKWLYLCYRGQTAGLEPMACSMHPEIEKIDWMWHTFILFTHDYAAFCEAYFDTFIHHMPTTEENGEPMDDATWQAELEKQYGFVYDVLGPETLTAWYEECRYAAEPGGSAPAS